MTLHYDSQSDPITHFSRTRDCGTALSPPNQLKSNRSDFCSATNTKASSIDRQFALTRKSRFILRESLFQCKSRKSFDPVTGLRVHRSPINSYCQKGLPFETPFRTICSFIIAQLSPNRASLRFPKIHWQVQRPYDMLQSGKRSLGKSQQTIGNSEPSKRTQVSLNYLTESLNYLTASFNYLMASLNYFTVSLSYIPHGNLQLQLT